LNERIKKVRKVLDLTQQDFADRIGSKRNTVATYEMGRSTPSAAVITLICKIFNVSERWLRTGEGEMFAPEPEFNLDEYVKRRGMTALERDILKAYLDLDPNLRETLLQHFKDRLAASSAGDAVPVFSPTSEDEAEAREMARLAYEQYLSEKKPAFPASSANTSTGKLA